MTDAPRGLGVDQAADTTPDAQSVSGGASAALEALVSRTKASERVSVPTAIGGTVPRWLAAAVLVLAGLAGWGAWQWVERPAPIEDRMPIAPRSPSVEESSERATSNEPAGSTPGDPDVIVHVAGAVLRPGVVTLDPGARVGDAVTAVGGLASGADVDRLNLAAPLIDGARVFVPTVGQEVPVEVSPLVPDTPGVGSTASIVDLNSADTSALETLPGIGPATASAILAHRDRNGDFESVEELLEVRGIGEAKLEALTGLVVVG